MIHYYGKKTAQKRDGKHFSECTRNNGQKPEQKILETNSKVSQLKAS